MFLFNFDEFSKGFLQCLNIKVATQTGPRKPITTKSWISEWHLLKWIFLCYFLSSDEYTPSSFPFHCGELNNRSRFGAEISALLSLTGKTSFVVDLGGQRFLPGFNDSIVSVFTAFWTYRGLCAATFFQQWNNHSAGCYVIISGCERSFIVQSQLAVNAYFHWAVAVESQRARFQTN